MEYTVDFFFAGEKAEKEKDGDDDDVEINMDAR